MPPPETPQEYSAAIGVLVVPCVHAVERWIGVMREQKVNRWLHPVLQQGDQLIGLIAPCEALSFAEAAYRSRD